MSGARKVNSELEQIVAGGQEETYRRRIEWANARGSRLSFLQQLRDEGVKGKDYSDKVAAYDRDTIHMSWSKNYGGNV